jgi:hypothetical protein
MDLANAFKAQETTTTNGMAALQSTMDSNVDLFFKIGASRGKNIVPQFTAAFVENRELALRIALWARDVRGGAGERQLFRDVLNYLEGVDPDAARSLILSTPELGRWDDLLIVKTPALRDLAFSLIKAGLESQNGLCAKWMPRKGKDAEALRAYLGYSPKRYRKTLVTLTQVVETQMCAKDWDNINFSHVPSVAAGRYRKAFKKNAEEAYTKYAEGLATGETKINAGAVFPYDVLKGNMNGYQRATLTKVERDVILAQWAALENVVGDAKMLPMVDVSGSMSCPAGTKSSVTCMDVAVSLGLYLAEKNTGSFRDMFITFTEQPTLYALKGNVLDKLDQMTGQVGYNTNLEAAYDALLKVAVTSKVAQEDMPEYIVMLSDMQFDGCTGRPTASAIDMIRDKYKAAGYTAPKVVFWNINAHDNVPVKFNDLGVALISGFSPTIVKSVLTAQKFSPQGIMLEAVMSDRYKPQ